MCGSKKGNENCRGASLAEFVLLLVCISLVAVSSLTSFGATLSSSFEADIFSEPIETSSAFQCTRMSGNCEGPPRGGGTEEGFANPPSEEP